jgi:PAS domain S-box-containing protein
MTEQAIGLLIASPADRALLTQFLEEAGYCVCFPAGAALKCNRQLSLIISDEQSARHYGPRLLEIKRRSENPFLPCLIVLPQNTCSAVWLCAGFDDVLRQPLTKEELKARIQVFLRFRDQCEQYRVIFEEVPIGIYRCLPDGKLLIANRAFASMFGFDSFRKMPNIAHLRLEPTLPGLVDRLTVQQQAIGLESVWQTPTGAIVYGLENTILVRRRGLVCIEGSLQDVTARRQTDRERDRLLAREQAAREVVFPRQPGREFDRSTRMAPASAAAPAGGLAAIRVLLVEDSPDMQDLFNFILTEAGAEVRIVATAEDALLELERRTPHILVSDIGLPGEDGYTLIRKVRTHADVNIQTIPAIALTAYAQTEDRIRSLQSGYQEHLTKPVEPAALIQTISSFVRQTRRATQRAS